MPPAKRQKAKPDPNASTDYDGWPDSCMGRAVLRSFTAAKTNAKHLVFGPTNACVFATRGDYQVVVKKRREGRSGATGTTDAYVYISGRTKRQAGVSQLRSVPEIVRHFNQHPDLNPLSFRSEACNEFQ